jgi:hypothetical protein
VTDRAANATQTLTRKFEVLPAGFGIVRVAASVDQFGSLYAPLSGVVGEIRWVHLHLVNFERDRVKKQPDIQLEVSVVDENDKPVVAKSEPKDIRELASDAVVVPIDFPIAFNRAGKFTLRLRALDRVNKKKAEISLPIRVTEPAAGTTLQTKPVKE